MCGKPSVNEVRPTLTTKPSARGAAGTVVLNDTATLARVDLTEMLNNTDVPATTKVCNSGTLPAYVESFTPLP